MSNSFNLDLFRRTYQGPTVRVKLVAAENAASYLPAIPFTSSKDVWAYFSVLEDEPREVVIVTYLGGSSRPFLSNSSVILWFVKAFGVLAPGMCSHVDGLYSLVTCAIKLPCISK